MPYFIMFNAFTVSHPVKRDPKEKFRIRFSFSPMAGRVELDQSTIELISSTGPTPIFGLFYDWSVPLQSFPPTYVRQSAFEIFLNQ